MVFQTDKEGKNRSSVFSEFGVFSEEVSPSDLTNLGLCPIMLMTPVFD